MNLSYMDWLVPRTAKLARCLSLRCRVAGVLVLGSYFGTVGFAVAAAPGVDVNLESAASAFKPYVLDRVAECISAARKMRERIAAHDLAGAQNAWLAARSGWEGSEVMTSEFFPDLDRKIDAWPDARSGFHAIEAKLFGAHDVNALVATEELISNLTAFEQQLRGAHLTAQGLLNGTAKLLFEIGESKAQGGESPFSGNSLNEMRNNLDSVASAFGRVFASTAGKRDAALAKTWTTDLEELRSLLAVSTLQQLDQARLRDVSETLVMDVVAVGRVCGLKKAELGN
jgi:iron uptake system component EfeO